MPARFSIVEEAERSPIWGPTRRDLESSLFLHGFPPSLFRHGQIDGSPPVALGGIVSEQAHDFSLVLFCELAKLISAREHWPEHLHPDRKMTQIHYAVEWLYLDDRPGIGERPVQRMKSTCYSAPGLGLSRKGRSGNSSMPKHMTNDLRGIMSGIYTKAKEWGYLAGRAAQPDVKVLARLHDPNLLIVETAIAKGAHLRNAWAEVAAHRS